MVHGNSPVDQSQTGELKIDEIDIEEANNNSIESEKKPEAAGPPDEFEGYCNLCRAISTIAK